jgi:hypothetical protein
MEKFQQHNNNNNNNNKKKKKKKKKLIIYCMNVIFIMRTKKAKTNKTSQREQKRYESGQLKHRRRCAFVECARSSRRRCDFFACA